MPPTWTTDLPPDLKGLVEAAVRARSNAYAPYSRFPVGAAVRTRSLGIYHGCNIENGSYGATVCAERVAIFSAMAAGERDFDALALVAEHGAPLTPCGICRQVLFELAPTLRVVMANLTGGVTVAPIAQLLPAPFVLLES
ncbi:MAG: cytidine deaminase [Burkholderiales bacterium]|nr:cytidine deaminase [Burkholderiales bacterium]